jgi:hypothetical protein
MTGLCKKKNHKSHVTHTWLYRACTGTGTLVTGDLYRYRYPVLYRRALGFGTVMASANMFCTKNMAINAERNKKLETSSEAVHTATVSPTWWYRRLRSRSCSRYAGTTSNKGKSAPTGCGRPSRDCGRLRAWTIGVLSLVVIRRDFHNGRAQAGAAKREVRLEVACT